MLRHFLKLWTLGGGSTYLCNAVANELKGSWPSRTLTRRPAWNKDGTEVHRSVPPCQIDRIWHTKVASLAWVLLSLVYTLTWYLQPTGNRATSLQTFLRDSNSRKRCAHLRRPKRRRTPPTTIIKASFWSSKMFLEQTGMQWAQISISDTGTDRDTLGKLPDFQGFLLSCLWADLGSGSITSIHRLLISFTWNI